MKYMMRIRFITIFVLLLLTGFFAGLPIRSESIKEHSAAPAVTVTVTAPTMSVETGTEFDVPATVSDTTGLDIFAYQFHIFYDPAILQLQTEPATLAGTISDGRTLTFNPNTLGVLKVSVFGTSPISGAGTLIIFKFTAIGVGPSLSPLHWETMGMGAFLFNEGDPDDQTIDGQVLILGNTGFDYDRDHRSDVSVFRQSTGAWYLEQSQAGGYGTIFGASTDKITPADFDGDGKTDIAVYRPSTGIWYVFNTTTGTVAYYIFGLAEDLPVPADYDGDRKADIAVFRPSDATWYRQNSSDGSYYAVQFGTSEDKPTVGDFDGDHKADIAIFRPSSGAWYRINSFNGSLFGYLFGNSADVIVPADYDGDGKTDVAVYRPSTGIWYVTRSLNGEVTYNVFGLAADIPAPGDFDGDGKADVCVFRPTDGNWYRQNSSNGSYITFPFGTNGDIPTQTAFRY